MDQGEENQQKVSMTSSNIQYDYAIFFDTIEITPYASVASTPSIEEQVEDEMEFDCMMFHDCDLTPLRDGNNHDEHDKDMYSIIPLSPTICSNRIVMPTVDMTKLIPNENDHSTTEDDEMTFNLL
jgi:hypothetical protein